MNANVAKTEGFLNKANVYFFWSCTDGNVNAKRNLYQFHKMIECSTNLSSYHYHDYGCYCGYGGGGNAVDETDM